MRRHLMNTAIAGIVAVLGFTSVNLSAQDQRGQGASPPPGVLEGKTRPSSGGGREAALPPRERGGEDRQDSFETRNAASTPVWVTVYQGGIVQAGGCVLPGQAAKWRVLESLGPARVRAEITGNERCDAPVLCEASIDRQRGTSELVLQGGPGPCAWQPSSRPASLKSGGYTNWVRNKTGAWAWITLYHNYWGSTIVSTGCAPPGGEGAIYIPVQGGNYDVRTEMTAGPNCGGRVVCDTRMNWPSALWSTRYFFLYASDRNCWLQ